MIGPAPVTANILTAMGNFLVAVLPNDVQIIAGQPNRVPEVSAPRFVIMSPPRFERIETNVDTATDSKFTASIAAGLMTVTAFLPAGQTGPLLDGPIQVGAVISGAGLAVPTTVTALGSGTGGTGTYTVSPSQTVGSETMSAGQKAVQMNTKVTVQLDFHAADDTSGDLANVVCALFRDDTATDEFANQSPSYGVVPLYADDARQVPFLNDQQAVEYRWIVEAVLQANIVVGVPQQFSDSIVVTPVSVEATYPA